MMTKNAMQVPMLRAMMLKRGRERETLKEKAITHSDIAIPYFYC